MRVGIIGAVNSTRITLEALVRHNFDIALVMGYSPADKTRVSGFTDLSSLSEMHGLRFQWFTKINENTEDIRAADLDVLFVVGLSQLVSEEILLLPKIGTVGFHPTRLPKGRGRAPIAWLTANCESGAATFFVINEIADSGPILVQEPFDVVEDDDALRVETKLLNAMTIALDRWLPRLKARYWNPVPQDDLEATEYGVRRPEDGLIDFNKDASAINRLVKATAPPHPGAFTFHKSKKYTVIGSRVETSLKIEGCVGRALKVSDGEVLVQAGQGLIWLKPQLGQGEVKVGDRLGFLAELEIFQMYNELQSIKDFLGIK